MVACNSAMVAQSPTTGACKVATMDGITHRSAQRNALVPCRDPVNGYRFPLPPRGPVNNLVKDDS